MHNAARAEYDRSWDVALELEIAMLQYRIYVPSLPKVASGWKVWSAPTRQAWLPETRAALQWRMLALAADRQTKLWYANARQGEEAYARWAVSWRGRVGAGRLRDRHHHSGPTLKV
jgi:hypothetical protein